MMGWIYLLMIFLHVVDDFYLQGILAKMKQRSWWKENAPQPLYELDWFMALIIHAFSWTFMIMLPIAYISEFKIGGAFTILFLSNLCIHAATDHLKANAKKISLYADQTIHVLQISATFLISYFVF